MPTIDGKRIQYPVYNMKDTFLESMYNNSKFYFTTKTNKQKFDERIRDFVEDETIKFTFKRGIDCDLDLYFAFVLYKKIEKRGVKILLYDGRMIESWQKVQGYFGVQLKT